MLKSKVEALERVVIALQVSVTINAIGLALVAYFYQVDTSVAL